MSVDQVRAAVRALASAVMPWDERERVDRDGFLEWVDSGLPLFRVVKPATPPQQHLAVYAALIDDRDLSIMLVHHLAAQAWLLPGVHLASGVSRTAVSGKLAT